MDTTQFDELQNIQFCGLLGSDAWVPRTALIENASLGHATGAATISSQAGKIRGVAVGFDGSCAVGDYIDLLDDTSLKARVLAASSGQTGYKFFYPAIDCSTSIKTSVSVTGNVSITVFYE